VAKQQLMKAYTSSDISDYEFVSLSASIHMRCLCLCVLLRRLIASAHEGLAAKQRLLDEYTSSNRSSQLQQTTSQLDGYRERRDAAARVSGLHMSLWQ
jgi:hypothetical protein